MCQCGEEVFNPFLTIHFSNLRSPLDFLPLLQECLWNHRRSKSIGGRVTRNKCICTQASLLLEKSYLCLHVAHNFALQLEVGRLLTPA